VFRGGRSLGRGANLNHHQVSSRNVSEVGGVGEVCSCGYSETKVRRQTGWDIFIQLLFEKCPAPSIFDGMTYGKNRVLRGRGHRDLVLLQRPLAAAFPRQA
jgi:hypothetical protein